MSVVVIGAYTRDLFMYGPRLPGPGETVDCPDYAEAHGGKAANQAVAAARLGASTAIITCLGDDPPGQAALSMFADEHVDTSLTTRTTQSPTGVSFIIVDERGQQLITTCAGASAQLTLADIERASSLLHRASVILLQGEIPFEVSVVAARLAGPNTTVVLDPSPAENVIAHAPFTGVHVVTPNEHEAALLTGTMHPAGAEIAAVTQAPTAIITHGARGAEVYYNGTIAHVPAQNVPVLDTTGAGDAFNGAYAAAISRGLDVLESVEFACRCAAISVQRRFCVPSFARLDEIMSG